MTMGKLKSNGIWCDAWGFKYQIWSNPMGSDVIHEILRLKYDEIQWNLMGFIHFKYKSYDIPWDLMGFMKFYNPNLIKPIGIWWDSWGFKTQILSNPIDSEGVHEVLQSKSYPLEYDGIHGVLRLKSYQIQLILKGFMRFYNPNLIKPIGIWWDSCGFKAQILSKPIDSEGVHEVLQSKSYQTHGNMMGFMGF